MIEPLLRSSEERWWAHLAPDEPTTRPALRERFVAAAQARAHMDRNLLSGQVNQLSIHLSNFQWGKNFYTADGLRCIQAPTRTRLGEPGDLRGWAKVLDAYGVFCEPIARYVGRYYDQLLGLRPDDLPTTVMQVLKDKARVQACNRVRDGIGKVGFGAGVGPVFAAEDDTRVFLADIAAGAPRHASLHEREAILTFADELNDWAVNKLEGDPWIVLNREKQLTVDDVYGIVDGLVGLSDSLRSQFADHVPTSEKAAETVEMLLEPVQARIADLALRIRQITVAGGEVPQHLDEESEFSDAARESTAKDLLSMVSRGHEKTPDDALRMYLGRIRQYRRNRFRGRHAQLEVEPPAPPVSAAESWLTKLKNYIVDHRDDMPQGLGEIRDDGRNNAEYDMALDVLTTPDDRDLQGRCEEKWPQFYRRAVAGDVESFVASVRGIIEWAGLRNGLRKGWTSK